MVDAHTHIQMPISLYCFFTFSRITHKHTHTHITQVSDASLASQYPPISPRKSTAAAVCLSLPHSSFPEPLMLPFDLVPVVPLYSPVPSAELQQQGGEFQFSIRSVPYDEYRCFPGQWSWAGLHANACAAPTTSPASYQHAKPSPWNALRIRASCGSAVFQPAARNLHNGTRGGIRGWSDPVWGCQHGVVPLVQHTVRQ